MPTDASDWPTRDAPRRWRLASPRRVQAMLRAAVVDGSYTQKLWMRVKRKAAYLPGC